MQNLKKGIITSLILFDPILSFATLKPFTPSDCQSLARPKTVLLVHASWCAHCKAYLPTYQYVSNLDKYKNWVFYELVDDKFEPVCGTSISGVPVTFKNKMKNSLVGNRTSSVLETFLDEK